MIKPTIHSNGTSRGDLHAAYMNALLATEEALKQLRKCAPHGRDYYPQGEDALMDAEREHEVRMRGLDIVRQDLEKLVCLTMPRGGK